MATANHRQSEPLVRVEDLGRLGLFYDVSPAEARRLEAEGRVLIVRPPTFWCRIDGAGRVVPGVQR